MIPLADDCPDCSVTLSLVLNDGRVRVCSCGAEYLPAPGCTLLPLASVLPARRRPDGPSLPRGAAVYLSAPDVFPERPKAPAPERVTTVEDPELVQVRALLYALRPERNSAFGCSADALPSLDAQPSPRRIVVQGDGGGSGFPTGLFAVTPSSPTADVTERLALLECQHPTEVRTLRWLRHHGELGAGLVALYRRAGLILATAEQRATWGASAAARKEAPRVTGRELVLAAADVWGEEK